MALMTHIAEENTSEDITIETTQNRESKEIFFFKQSKRMLVVRQLQRTCCTLI